MESPRLNRILEQCSDVKVAVVGDFCLDVYWIVDKAASEKSLETGLMTQPVRHQRESLGGAGNIAANLTALGVPLVSVVGAIGDDPFGSQMLRLMHASNIRHGGLVAAKPPWATPVFIKPHIGPEEIARFDLGMFNGPYPALEEQLCRNIAAAAAESDAIIINCQLLRSIYSAPIAAEINRLIADYTKKHFIIDSRHNANLFGGAILKVNESEAAKLAGSPAAGGSPLAEAQALALGRQLIAKYGYRAVVITRGDRGMLWITSGDQGVVPGIQILEQIDPVGAGDTACACLAASLAAGASLGEASFIANLAASVTVRKLRECGTATPAEILQAFDSADYVYLPELAEDARSANYAPGSEIEIIRQPPPGFTAMHAIFDHDGTISALRQGWEEIMAPVMVRAILGESFQSASPALLAEIGKQVQSFIDKSTGIQTINQMEFLVAMVRNRNFVPRDRILDRWGYKRVYNDALMEMVNKRMRRFLKKNLSLEDYTIKGSVGFLKMLRHAGCRLYLASGTDEEDLMREASTLGYADLFDGGIFGATGDIDSCSKRMVVSRILDQAVSAQAGLICFGDGPVEIREAKRRGGFTIGIASDEIRRFGLNLSKRARLIKAGADIIVPDFSEPEILLRLIVSRLAQRT